MAFKMKRNDTRPIYKAQLMQTDPLDAENMIPIDLTTATAVKFLMKQGSTLKVTHAATITDAANGKVQYTWLSGDTDTTGVYNAEFEVAWGTDKQTFPSDGYAVVEITDDLG